MTMENQYKEVYFDQYCGTCKYENTPESEDPCDECMLHGSNLYSHKPVNWKEKEKGSK